MPLIRNGCLNVTVSRRDLVKISFLELAGPRAIQRELNRFRASSPAFVANRLFAAREYSPASGAFGEHRLRLRLLRPNSHDFLFKPRCAPVGLRSDRPDRYSPASRDGLARPGGRSGLRPPRGS